MLIAGLVMLIVLMCACAIYLLCLIWQTLPKPMTKKQYKAYMKAADQRTVLHVLMRDRD